MVVDHVINNEDYFHKIRLYFIPVGLYLNQELISVRQLTVVSTTYFLFLHFLLVVITTTKVFTKIHIYKLIKKK